MKMSCARAGLLIAACFCTFVAGNVQISIDTSKHIQEVRQTFLGITIDSGMLYVGYKDDASFRCPKLHTLARALAPTLWRIGGKAADRVVFNDESIKDAAHMSVSPHYPIYSMSAKQWDALNNFAQSVGWEILFNLNALTRNSDDTWDSTNAVAFLKYSMEHGYNKYLHLELANEPDVFPYGKGWNYSLPGEQLAADFRALTKILREDAKFKEAYANSQLVGPSPFHVKLLPLYKKFMAATEGTEVDYVNVHHYYFDGKNATLDWYLDVDRLNSMVTYMDNADGPKLASKLADKKYWIAETSSSYKGGTPDISDRYLATFVWLDKLGYTATRGVVQLARQSMFSGQWLTDGDPTNITDTNEDYEKDALTYSLLDRNLDPNPDYWLSYVYRNLVGTKVLAVVVSAERDEEAGYQRMYAHCTSDRSGHKEGSVTVFGMNMDQKQTKKLQFAEPLGSQEVDAFFLTHPKDDPARIKSKFIALNGKTMRMVDDFTLPWVQPIRMKANDIQLEPLTSGFFVFPNAKAAACTSGKDTPAHTEL